MAKQSLRVGSFRISDARERSDLSGLSFEGDPGKTDPSFKEEVDINNILKKADMSLIAQHFAEFNGDYTDFTHDLDHHTMLLRIQEANDMFLTLPARVRAKFGNDVQAFLDFTANEANRDEMIDLGLMKPEVVKSSQIASNAVLSGIKGEVKAEAKSEAKSS